MKQTFYFLFTMTFMAAVGGIFAPDTTYAQVGYADPYAGYAQYGQYPYSASAYDPYCGCDTYYADDAYYGGYYNDVSVYDPYYGSGYAYGNAYQAYPTNYYQSQQPYTYYPQTTQYVQYAQPQQYVSYATAPVSYGGYSTYNPYSMYPQPATAYTGIKDTFGTPLCSYPGYGNVPCGIDPRQPVRDFATGRWY